jgi:hypothetical protein
LTALIDSSSHRLTVLGRISVMGSEQILSAALRGELGFYFTAVALREERLTVFEQHDVAVGFIVASGHRHAGLVAGRIPHPSS